MSWSRIIPISLAVLVAGLGIRSGVGSGGGRLFPAGGADGRAASGGAPMPRRDADPRVDSARAELQAGRPWHASEILRSAARTGLALSAEEVLLLAQADAGWRNWAGVVERLAGQSWIDDVGPPQGEGEGRLLLARAHEARQDWSAAAASYDRYVATAHAAANPLRPGIAARQARSLARATRTADARAALDRIDVPVVTSWAALDAASAPADSGRVADVRAFVERITDPGARLNAWELVPRALLASGDSTAAERVYREVAGTVMGNRRARAWTVAGDLACARRDSATARSAYLSALAEGPATPAAGRAAGGLLAVGASTLDADQVLVAARALDRANDYGPAVRAYDLHVRLEGGVANVVEDVRLARASRLAATPGRENDAVEEFRALATSAGERIGAVALDRWSGLRARQGRAGDVRTIEGWLLERYPQSPEAADVLFFRADAPHDRNQLDAAAAAYRRLIETVPAQDRAGLGTMRLAQIHLLRGEHSRAAEIYEDYLERFPNGRRWQEASYWAARIHRELGDDARARDLIARLRRDDPLSYYTVLAADLVGEEFRLDLPAGAEPPMPAWLEEGIGRVDLLRAAGLVEGETAEVDRLIARARGDQASQIRLAQALIERDHTIPAIRLGFDLRQSGAPWTLRLARIIYPWGYREVFVREARESGVDPFLTAALARQESAFDPDIRSVANAVGLMQLLPSTAAQVAREVGPRDFREELLEVPDVNVHLGTRHLVDLLRQNQADTTRFLAGYNAGQHRVVRWRDFAEAGDLLTFTERIPFAETRDYVKQVRRNVAIYRMLYGAGR